LEGVACRLLENRKLHLAVENAQANAQFFKDLVDGLPGGSWHADLIAGVFTTHHVSHGFAELAGVSEYHPLSWLKQSVTATFQDPYEMFHKSTIAECLPCAFLDYQIKHGTQDKTVTVREIRKTVRTSARNRRIHALLLPAF
jgi:alpha-beta hydrolase superfamily lysophospholipase